jgi:hypothetical protein
MSRADLNDPEAFAQLHMQRLAENRMQPNDKKLLCVPTPYWQHADMKPKYTNATGIFADKSLVESNGKKIVRSVSKFENWGGTIHNAPLATFQPSTIAGVQNIVKWAIKNKKRVRVSGYRHSWSSLYSQDGSILISLLPIEVATELPARYPPMDPNNEFQFITFVKTTVENGITYGLTKIGSATTNYHFRKWALENNWTVPCNVVMSEITFGGSNAPICHGAGINNQTLSDIVREIEFINVKGETQVWFGTLRKYLLYLVLSIVQVVSDREQLKAAAGCFGLLGVVISLTLRLDAMTYALQSPKKVPVETMIPPPANTNLSKLPTKLRIPIAGMSAKDREASMSEFIRLAKGSYYSEFFWFPDHPQCWVNCWDTTADPSGSIDYPTPFEDVVQQLEESVAETLNGTLFKALTPRNQAQFTGRVVMATLAPNVLMPEPFKTPIIDAIHFRRGVQNMRVLDFEVEIPIPLVNGEPDWSVVQQAWWIVISDFYARDASSTPMGIAMEMRIMGGSDMFLAPQFGNWGTCSIEVLSTVQTDAKEWREYNQVLLDKWMGINNAKLNVRPHWAKQWEGLKVGRRPLKEYLKNTAYKAQIPLFKAQLSAIAADRGYTLNDIRGLYSNPLLDYLIFDAKTADNDYVDSPTAVKGCRCTVM